MKTKKRAVSALALCFVLPLLMSNSVYPYPYPQDYDSFTNTEITNTYIEADNEYQYETTLTNTGSNYLYLPDCIIKHGDELFSHPTNVSNSDLLAPNHSFEYIVSHQNSYAAASLKLNCKAYVDIQALTLSNMTNIVKTYSDVYRCNSYSFTLSIKEDVSCYAVAILDFNIAGDVYSFKDELIMHQGLNDFTILTERDFDTSKMSLTNVGYAKGQAVEVGPNSYVNTTLVVVCSILAIVLVGALVAFLIVLFAVILPLKKKRDATNK